jgi:hypothetical protein
VVFWWGAAQGTPPTHQPTKTKFSGQKFFSDLPGGEMQILLIRFA